MKVVVLGAGGMGRFAARATAGFDFVEELVVADLDESAAVDCAEALGCKARGARVDVTDPSDLARVLRDATAVLNTVGPFFRLGPRVLDAALEAGTHYLDINDDWESTEVMLDRDAEARRRGVTAVIGLGASPGLSNLLAVTAMRELDEAKVIYTGFDLDAATPEIRGRRPSAATVHGLHQLTGRIRAFDRGRFVAERPLRAVELEYPGLGRRTGWTMGHPEAVTFPRYFPELERSLVVMTLGGGKLWLLRLVRGLVDANLLSLERAATWVERLEGVDRPAKVPTDYLRELAHERSPKLPPLFAIVGGTRDGMPASAAATILSAPARGMGGATGVPLAVGLAVLRPDGEQRRGVFAPEALIEPSSFFDALAPLCAPSQAGCHDLVIVSRSWADVDLPRRLRETSASTGEGAPCRQG